MDKGRDSYKEKGKETDNEKRIRENIRLRNTARQLWFYECSVQFFHILNFQNETTTDDIFVNCCHKGK
jgi:hypothetical protein